MSQRRTSELLSELLSELMHVDARGRSTALTKPMRIVQLAGIFGVNRNTMSQMLKVMPGAEKLGTFWRVTVEKMPVQWRRENDLLDL